MCKFVLDGTNENKDSDIYDSDLKPFYKQFSIAFREMHADVFGTFKKISHKRKLISKLEKEICDLNSSLYSLKEEHASFVNV